MKALDGTILKPYPGSFVHGVDRTIIIRVEPLYQEDYIPDFVALQIVVSLTVTRALETQI
jgi:hypothetical protein